MSHEIQKSPSKKIQNFPMESKICQIDHNLHWQTSLKLTLPKTFLFECDSFPGSKVILYYALF